MPRPKGRQTPGSACPRIACQRCKRQAGCRGRARLPRAAAHLQLPLRPPAHCGRGPEHPRPQARRVGAPQRQLGAPVAGGVHVPVRLRAAGPAHSGRWIAAASRGGAGRLAPTWRRQGTPVRLVRLQACAHARVCMAGALKCAGRPPSNGRTLIVTTGSVQFSRLPSTTSATALSNALMLGPPCGRSSPSSRQSMPPPRGSRKWRSGWGCVQRKSRTRRAAAAARSEYSMPRSLRGRGAIKVAVVGGGGISVLPAGCKPRAALRPPPAACIACPAACGGGRGASRWRWGARDGPRPANPAQPRDALASFCAARGCARDCGPARRDCGPARRGAARRGAAAHLSPRPPLMRSSTACTRYLAPGRPRLAAWKASYSASHGIGQPDKGCCAPTCGADTQRAGGGKPLNWSHWARACAACSCVHERDVLLRPTPCGLAPCRMHA